MNRLAEAFFWVGCVGFCVWGMVSCQRINNADQFKRLEFYTEHGFKQDKWGSWTKP